MKAMEQYLKNKGAILFPSAVPSFDKVYTRRWFRKIDDFNCSYVTVYARYADEDGKRRWRMGSGTLLRLTFEQSVLSVCEAIRSAVYSTVST